MLLKGNLTVLRIGLLQKCSSATFVAVSAKTADGLQLLCCFVVQTWRFDCISTDLRSAGQTTM